MKTNACRILDALHIPYTTREYAVDPDDLTGQTVARKIGLPEAQVFKTLLCRIDTTELVFAVLSVAQELDFKKLAVAAGGHKAKLASLSEVQPLTGYIRGGVTVFGGKKDFPVFADRSIEIFDIISVSAGTRGLQILLAPADYLRAANATVVDLATHAGDAP
ncbi:MAG TPA: Cys-tRNA(Pro) deacylase [Acidobacteriaceae bacterium]|jgi:Cys-tRNA(Pro)/Cys-tRNA(Cys) deacylase|nr:Cys-tRNA(Pro) deacylase [Acidobacteriaceae bacterium]